MKGYRRTAQFIRHYKQRIAKNEQLQKEFLSSLETFQFHPNAVGDHPLKNSMHGKRAFWINGEYRVTYQEKDEYYLLVDIGNHDEVYT